MPRLTRLRRALPAVFVLMVAIWIVSLPTALAPQAEARAAATAAVRAEQLWSLPLVPTQGLVPPGGVIAPPPQGEYPQYEPVDPCVANPALCEQAEPVETCATNPDLCPEVETCATNPDLCPEVETCATNPDLCPEVDPCVANPALCKSVDPCEQNRYAPGCQQYVPECGEMHPELCKQDVPDCVKDPSDSRCQLVLPDCVKDPSASGCKPDCVTAYNPDVCRPPPVEKQCPEDPTKCPPPVTTDGCAPLCPPPAPEKQCPEDPSKCPPGERPAGSTPPTIPGQPMQTPGTPAPGTPTPGVPAVDTPAVQRVPDPTTPPVPHGLVLSFPVVNPGEDLTVTGEGCPPGSPVAMSVGGVSAGTVVADDTGAFRAPLSAGSTDMGRYQVSADCGPVLTAPLDVVLVSQTGGSASTMLVIVFFLLVGLLLYRRRLLPLERR